jgi:hypothetical protein
MYRSRIAGLALAAGLSLVAGCSSCTQFSLFGGGKPACCPAGGACCPEGGASCGPAPCMSAPSCYEGYCGMGSGNEGYCGMGPGLHEGGPFLGVPGGEVIPPAGPELTMPPLAPPPGGVPLAPPQGGTPVGPPPRLVPEPQAQGVPYTPAARPRLLGKLDR